MEKMAEIWAYITLHGPAIAAILLGIVALAETIVRVTPTKKDDTAVERVGKVIRKAIDYIGKFIPNKKEGGGEHPKQKEKEEPAKEVKK